MRYGRELEGSRGWIRSYFIVYIYEILKNKEKIKTLKKRCLIERNSAGIALWPQSGWISFHW